jgi:hypothetical protein
MRSPLSRRGSTALSSILVGALAISLAGGSAAAAASAGTPGPVNPAVWSTPEPFFAAPSALSASATTVPAGTDALAIAMSPSTNGASLAFDSARGDSVSASIVGPQGSVPEQLYMTARTPAPGPQPSAMVTISHSESLVVGANDAAAGRLDPGCSVSSGTITVAELTRDATGLTSFSGSFDAVCSTGDPIRGVLRWHSALPYTALTLTSSVIDAGPVEVGHFATTRVSLTNVGNAAAAVWPPSFAGPTAGDWSAAASSTCNSGSDLAPAATCALDVVFAPSAGDERRAVMGVPSPQGPGSYDVSLAGLGVGKPTPPTDVQANGSVFGAVVTWGRPTNSGGAMSDSATIEKTGDGGLTWARLATITGTGLDSRTYADRLGVAPGAVAGYRVSTTQVRVAPGQTTTYASDVSAVAVATGARQSLVIDGISAYDGYRPISLRGSMNPDVPIPGFFLPSTDSGPWAESPDGSEIVMASIGAGTTALPYELRRRPALGQTAVSTSIYAAANALGDVVWSPDGSTLAWREYHRDNSTAYLMVGSAAGGSVRSLDLTNFWDFHWMPDSRTLAGISNTPGGGVVTFVDTRTAAMTTTTAPAMCIGLSPDARRLVTTTTDSNLRNEFFDVYTLDPNSRSLSAAVRTQKPYLGISRVEFSPDGRELLTSQRYQFARWPLTSGNVVLDTGPNTQTGELSNVSWHSYRPALAPSPATTGPTAAFTIQAGRMAPGTTFQCAADDGPPAGCSTSWTTPSLAPGRHTVRVIGTEPSGRSATVARTWMVTAPTLYTAVSPKRVMDTRNGTGTTKAKVAGGGRVTLTIPGLPAGTTAVTLNVTATNPTAASYLTAYPAGAVQPSASNLNYVKGQTVANLVVVAVGSGGRVTFFNSAGTVDLIADLAGYHRPSTGTRFLTRPPDRIMDTRIGLGAAKATVGPGQVTLMVPGLPAGTTAVVLNVTVTNPTAASYLTVYPAGTTRPTASNLNFVRGQTIANLVIVPVGTGGKVTFYNNAGTVEILADLAGEYTATGARLTPLNPVRVLDTRIGIGAPVARVSHLSEVTLTLPDLPDGVTAIALNVTAASPTLASDLAVNPTGQQAPGTLNVVSNLNFLAGQTVPNLVIVGVAPGNRVTFTVDAGSVDVIADLAGYFMP